MNYILTAAAILSAIYVSGYVKQTWKEDKFPAVGALIAAILAIAMPIFAMLRK